MIQKEQVRFERIAREKGEKGVSVAIELTSSPSPPPSPSSCQERERRVGVSDMRREEEDGAKIYSTGTDE